MTEPFDYSFPDINNLGWCEYQFPETTSDSTNLCNDDDDDINEMQIKIAAAFAVAATVLSLIILCFLFALKFFPQFCSRTSSAAKNGPLAAM